MTDMDMHISAPLAGPEDHPAEAVLSGLSDGSLPPEQAVRDFQTAMEGKFPVEQAGENMLSAETQDFNYSALPSDEGSGGSRLTAQAAQEFSASGTGASSPDGKFSAKPEGIFPAGENMLSAQWDNGVRNDMGVLRTVQEQKQPADSELLRSGEEKLSSIGAADSAADAEGREDPLRRELKGDRAAMVSVSDMFSGMMSPLDSIISGHVQQAETAQPPQLEQDRLESMVDRILVSAPDDGGREVRLTLNTQALKDTEIIIHRDVSGTLSITLQANDRSVFQTLVASQGELKQMLETQEKGEVRVTVNSDAQGGQNDTNRRSSGYMEYDLNE